jgi:2-keto-3-deoxy-L-rhamnonate aldolase RhmA
MDLPLNPFKRALAAGRRQIGLWCCLANAYAVEAVAVRIRKAGKAPGILFSDEARVRRYLELGAQVVAVGVDLSILVRESEKLATKYRT